MQVGGWALLERDRPVTNVGGERTECSVVIDVVDDPGPVADPVGAALVDGFADGGETVGLPRMYRERKPGPPEQMEGRQMPGRWVPGFRSGDVEADYALVPVAQRRFGYLQAPGAGPHGGQQRTGTDFSPLAPVTETSGDRSYDFVQ